MTIAELLDKWQQDASRMDDFADVRGATLCRRFAAELSEAVRAAEAEARVRDAYADVMTAWKTAVTEFEARGQEIR